MRCEVIEREGVKYNDDIHIITIIMIIYTLFLSIHTQIYVSFFYNYISFLIQVALLVSGWNIC